MTHISKARKRPELPDRACGLKPVTALAMTVISMSKRTGNDPHDCNAEEDGEEREDWQPLRDLGKFECDLHGHRATSQQCLDKHIVQQCTVFQKLQHCTKACHGASKASDHSCSNRGVNGAVHCTVCETHVAEVL